VPSRSIGLVAAGLSLAGPDASIPWWRLLGLIG
jgi:hypothetical protein